MENLKQLEWRKWNYSTDLLCPRRVFFHQRHVHIIPLPTVKIVLHPKIQETTLFLRKKPQSYRNLIHAFFPCYLPGIFFLPRLLAAFATSLRWTTSCRGKTSSMWFFLGSCYFFTAIHFAIHQQSASLNLSVFFERRRLTVRWWKAKDQTFIAMPLAKFKS